MPSFSFSPKSAPQYCGYCTSVCATVGLQVPAVGECLRPVRVRSVYAVEGGLFGLKHRIQHLGTEAQE